MLAVVSGAWPFQNPLATYPGTEPLAIGVPPLESSALIYIAEDQHFFADNGLNVTIRDYEPAIAGVDGLLRVEVDLAGASEYAVVVKAFKRENISIIVSGDEVQSNYLVGRKDRGIENVSDLRGKKIGIPRGTNVEFYLGRFLLLHGLDPRDVTIVDVRPAQFVNATLNGDVDAIICWQPYVNKIKDRLGNGTVTWPAQSSQLTYGVIVCRNDWATQHPELMSRFLKSLDLAAEYTIDHPDEAKAIVQKMLNFSDEYMAAVWPQNHFSLSLDQSLVTAMEDEARWMIKNNLTNEKTVPDFRDYIYTKGLEEVMPESVNIIRRSERYGDQHRYRSKTVKKVVAALAVLSVLVLAGIGAWHFITSPKSYSGPTESIVLGGLVSDANIMLYTAEDQHFFAENGINFTFRTYGTGLETINDLLDKKLDIAGAAEYPVVAKAFEKDNISIIASISKSYIEYFVGLTDKGIRSVADLKGKKIGLPVGTIQEFYLGRFLDLHGMSIRDVTLINIPPGKTASAIANGSVDAVVTWEPYVSRILEEHPNGTVSWSVQSSQAVYSILICRNDWIEQHPDLVRRFLNSLSQADGYMVLRPAEAKAILQKRYNYDDEYVARVWPENQFSLSLDQSLVTALEDEGRWMIKNNLTTEKSIPDFRDYIYLKGLDEVKPEAVNVIR